MAAGVENRPRLVGQIRRQRPVVLLAIALLPIAGDGESPGHDLIQIVGVAVFLDQDAVIVIGLGVAIGEEVALAALEEGFFFLRQVGTAIVGDLELLGRLVVLGLPEQRIAFGKGRLGDLFVRALAPERLPGVGESLGALGERFPLDVEVRFGTSDFG